MLRRSALALLLLACSDPAPAPSRPAPEPAPRPPAPEAVTPPAEAEAPEAEGADERDEDVEDESDQDLVWSFDTELTADDGEIEHPSPHVRRVLEGLWRNLNREQSAEAVRRAPFDANEAEEEESTENAAYGGCGVLLMHPHLVTFACSDTWSVRDDQSVRERVLHYAIAGDEVRPLDALDLFSSREAIVTRLRTECEAAVAEGVEEDGEQPGEGSSCDRIVARLDDDSVSLVYEASDFLAGAYFLDRNVYYEDLAALIPEGGLLRRLFAGEAPPAEPAPAAPNGMAVSKTDLDHALVAAWQALEPAQRASVGMQRFGHGLARLVYVGSDAAAAAAIAAALGATPTPVRAEPAVRPLAAPWMTARTDALVRTRPEGPLARVLPAGTLLVQADPADRARFVEVLTPLGPGFVARSLLAPRSGCVPSAPGARPGEPAPLAAIVRVERAGAATRDGVLFARPTERGVAVRLHALDAAACTVGDELLALDAEGELVDLRLGATSARGGDTLLVVGTSTDDEDQFRYVARALGLAEPVWAETVRRVNGFRAGVRVAETADATYFPVSIETFRGLRRLAWTGTALAEQAPAP